MSRGVAKPILYVLSAYDIYLYLPDILDVFKLNIDLPSVNWLLYFDAAMLLLGGVATGILLIKIGGKFNKGLGLVMIAVNVILTPMFLLRAMP